MPTYVINEIVITEPDRFQTYADQVPAILKAYGGESAAARLSGWMGRNRRTGWWS